MEETKELKPLNKKQQKVLDEYLLCFNQWRAYKSAYPNVTDESARSLSSKLFAEVNFAGHLSARLNEVHMSANEALKLMADIARGDIGDFINNYGGVDLLEASKQGKTKLIKKIRTKTTTINGKDEDKEITEEEIELYPADAALRDILKMHGKYKEQVDITTNGKDIEIIDNERFDRAISALTDALGEIISGKSDKPDGKVGSTK